MRQLLASSLIGLAIVTGTVHADDTVRIALDVPYEPFEYRDADGELTGFDIDLGNALCKEAGVECEWVIQRWDGLIPGLMARKYDAIMSSMVITAERERKVLFTHPYSATPRAWIAPADRTIDIDDKPQLAGMTVGVERATLQDRYITDLYGDAMTVRRYDTVDDMIVDLQTGRLKLAFMNYPIAETHLHVDAQGSEFKRVSGFIKGPEKYFGKGVGIAFRKRDKALVERFNDALDTLRDNGTYDEIMKTYFSYDISP
ncbi:transporter substrate-binding domain-containing protein [Modicisalibacter coralii]|uniref:transporter substrate-binding domain-containing protein n=1 Tax=Modicisalibacter coralii TaxID=2304602 RepID=UPI00100B6CFD|nr:transporter substrate-binding domain-containing protein [Halomonas coralii]